MGSGIAERAALHSMRLGGSARMCLCARVFLLRVCSLSRLYTDMHLLPCLEQRQLPLPFISSQHKLGMKYLSQCKIQNPDPNLHTMNHQVTPQLSSPCGNSDLAGDSRKEAILNTTLKRWRGGKHSELPGPSTIPPYAYSS